MVLKLSDSLSKPLGRCVHSIFAVLQITRIRAGKKEAAAATECLAWHWHVSGSLGFYQFGLGSLAASAATIIIARSSALNSKPYALSFTPGLVRSRFLRFVDNERLLQLALLADAAEEAKALTRLTDRESCETEKVAQEVEAYLARITMLFIDRGCREFGYTNFPDPWADLLFRTPFGGRIYF